MYSCLLQRYCYRSSGTFIKIHNRIVIIEKYDIYIGLCIQRIKHLKIILKCLTAAPRILNYNAIRSKSRKRHRHCYSVVFISLNLSRLRLTREYPDSIVLRNLLAFYSHSRKFIYNCRHSVRFLIPDMSDIINACRRIGIYGNCCHSHSLVRKIIHINSYTVI